MQQNELPKDIASERAVISILLTKPERFIEVIDALVPTDFYRDTHQQIWASMQDLFKQGHDFDIVSIKSQLGKNEANVKPALEAVVSAYENEVLDTNLLRFVQEVKNKSLLRQIIKVATAHSYNAQLEDAEAETVLANLERDIVSVVEKTASLTPIDAEAIVNEVKADAQKRKETGWQGFNTGFTRMDNLTGGLIPTQSWIVGAYTGVGKSFFLLQIMLNVLRQGGKVMLFSTEMDRKINMLRLAGNISGLSTINIMRGNLIDEQQRDLESAYEELAKFKDNLTIYDNVYTMADMRLKAKKAKLTNGLDVVIVDFIQNLRGKESIYERMADAAVSLQQLAQELNITMLIGSQVSQGAAGWSSKEAIEFKGAGEIAAIADVAIWIIKDKGGDPSMRTVFIRKARHGAPGKFDAKLTFPAGRFADVLDRIATAQGDSDDITGQL